MRSVILATASVALLTSVVVSGNLQAAPYADARMSSQLSSAALIENIQYVWEGRRYCWYEDGWHGPGWYWCGYRLREGLGWGGERGWRNWERREWREHRREERLVLSVFAAAPPST